MPDSRLEIWVVKQGETLPFGDTKSRLMRAGLISEALSRRGHHVTWWTSTFEHFSKKNVFLEDTERTLACGTTMRLLRSPGYTSALSPQRIRDHTILTRRFAEQIRKEPKPDIIVCALPIPSLARECVRFGKEFHVPVVVDIRDWWPDIFLQKTPSFARPLARLLMRSVEMDVRYACEGAYAITGVTPDFLQWGLNKAGRGIGDRDSVFYLGYPLRELTAEQSSAAGKFWQSKGITGDSDKSILVYIGGFNRTMQISPIIEAARELKGSSKPLLFVLCGKGDLMEGYQRQARDLDNVVFPGWLGGEEILCLMGMAKAGLVPYPNRADFISHISNKPIEYLSAALPLIASPRIGTLYNLIKDNKCGVSYDDGDAHGLAVTIDELFKNEEELRLMAQNARDLFKNRFMADRVYGEMAEYLKEIVYLYKSVL